VVHLELDHGAIRLTADADTDEVIVRTLGSDASLPDLSEEAVFAPLLGKVIEYAWSMTNHRGHADAFQIRFLDLASRDQATRQFEVGAAVLFVRNVS
jgi:hypothetical protein